MKRTAILALLLAVTGLCSGARAAEEGKTQIEEISYDATALTARVLEAFPDGLPFSRTGSPTDDDKAKQFWQLIADTQMTFKAREVTPGSGVHMVCAVAGVPLFLTETALEKLKAADAGRHTIDVSDSIENVVLSIAQLAGVERAVVEPMGLILATSDDPDKITDVISIPPQPVFLWRAKMSAVLKEAFPDGLDMKNASDEDKRKIVQIAMSTRCDLVVPGRGELDEFIRWIAAKSSQPLNIEEAVYRQITESEQKVGPISVRFTPFLEALNAALEPTGFVVTAEGPHFKISLAEPADEAEEEAEGKDGP